MATSENFTVFDCPAIQKEFEERPDPVGFEETSIIRRVHGSVPRFGHTSDINYLLLGPDDERSDYAKGLFAASLLIAAFIIVWFIMLCVFRCLGPKNVGMLSGKLFQPHQAPARSRKPNDQRNEDLDDDKVLLPAAAQVYDSNDMGAPRSPSNHSQKPSVSARQKQILTFTRVTVLTCSLGIVACSVFMVTKGAQSLVSAKNSALDGIEKGQSLADQAVGLIDHFIRVADSSTRASREFILELNTGFCPAVREELCTNLETAWAGAKEVDGVLVDENGVEVNVEDLPDVECDFSGIPYGMDVELLLNTKTTAVRDQLYYTRADIVEVSEKLATLREKGDDFNWAFAVASAFALLLALLCLIISYGVLEAWFGCSKNRNCLLKLFACLRSWLLLPVFIFLVIMAWLFSMIFVIGSTAASDMCVDSPDGRIKALLIEYGDFVDSNGDGDVDINEDSLILLFFLFYINGCPAGGSPRGFIEQITEVLTVLDTAIDLVNNVVAGTDASVAEICGADPKEFVASAATNAFEEALCDLGEALVNVQKFFSCENWRPLYRLVVYDAVCYNLNDGFYYVSITQFCIVVFAMIMLTCRVAFTEIEPDEDGATSNDLDNAAAAMADTGPPPEDRINVAAVEAYDDAHNPSRNWTTTPAPQY